MDNNPSERDALTEKANSTTSVMSSLGWKKGTLNVELVGVDSVFFYVVDYQTQWFWTCSIPKDLFDLLLQKTADMVHAETVSHCGLLIAKAAALDTLGADLEEELGISLTAYISATETFARTERAIQQNHFAVIRYGAKPALRPFAMPGPARHHHSVLYIKDCFARVFALDAQNHPDWLGR